jgi:hypothetical protein
VVPRGDRIPRLIVAALLVVSVVGLLVTLSRVVRPESVTMPDSLDPITILERRAYAEFREKKYETSLATCAELLTRDHANGYAVYVRGLNRKLLGQTHAARAEFRAASAMFPEGTDLHFLCLAQLKDLTHAAQATPAE